MALNDNYIIVYDFETCSAKPQTTEITQIAAQVIHPETLELGPTFNSECSVLDVSLIEEGALEVTGKTREGIASAPHPKVVWGEFVAFVQKYNRSATKSAYKAPISAGWNIDGFDSKITERYCQQYGPIDKKKNCQALFSSVYSIDLMKIFWLFAENTNDIENMKLTTILEFLGLSSEGAHDALVDVRNTAKVLSRTMKLFRNWYPRISFAGAFLNDK